MLKKTVKIINEIANTQGTNAKIDMVKGNIDNELMKDIFAFQFDDSIKTKISIKKLSKDVDINKAEVEIFDIYDYISFLSNDCTGKDAHVATIKKYGVFCQKQYGDEVAMFVVNMAMKAIKLGSLGRKGIAKIYGEGFLTKVESMGGQDWVKNKDKKDVKGKSVYWSLKIDGYRLHPFLYEDGTTEFFTRSGKKREGFEEIAKWFKELDYPRGKVADIEVRLPKMPDENAGACFRRSQTIFANDEIKTGLEVRIFDLIDMEDFKNGKSKETYEERRSLIEAQKTSDMFKPTEILYIGNDEEIIEELMIQVVEEWQEEGLIGFVEGSDWKAGKSRRILKYKPFKDVDLRICGFEQGDPAKSFSHTLGTLFVDWKGNKVGVGSGLSMELREEIWNNQDKYMNRIIEVRYLHESQDENGVLSLRHTSFLGFRDDKKTISL